jgi:hypothetical protein
LSDQSVQVGVGWTVQVEVFHAKFVDGLKVKIVNHFDKLKMKKIARDVYGCKQGAIYTFVSQIGTAPAYDRICKSFRQKIK